MELKCTQGYHLFLPASRPLSLLTNLPSAMYPINNYMRINQVQTLLSFPEDFDPNL